MGAGESVIVYNGGGNGMHSGIFMSSCAEFAADYGPVRTFELDVSCAFDSLNPDHVRGVLPLSDPYDGSMVETLEQYFERSSDTWEMIEKAVSSYPVVIIYEGGVRNFLVNDVSRLREVSPVPPKRPAFTP